MKLNLSKNVVFKAIKCNVRTENGFKFELTCPDQDSMHIDINDDNLRYCVAGNKNFYYASDIYITSVDNNSSLFIYDNTELDKPLTVENVSKNGKLVIKGQVRGKSAPGVIVKAIKYKGSVKLLSGNANIDLIAKFAELVVKYGSRAKVNKNQGYIYIKGEDNQIAPKLNVKRNYHIIDVDISNPLPQKDLSSVIIKENYGIVHHATNKHKINIDNGKKLIEKVAAVIEKNNPWQTLV